MFLLENPTKESEDHNTKHNPKTSPWIQKLNPPKSPKSTTKVPEYHKQDLFLKEKRTEELGSGKYVFTPKGIQKSTGRNIYKEGKVEVINDNKEKEELDIETVSPYARFNILTQNENYKYSIINIRVGTESTVKEITQKVIIVDGQGVKGVLNHGGSRLKDGGETVKDKFKGGGEGKLLMTSGGLGGPVSDNMKFWRSRYQDIDYGWRSLQGPKDAIRFIPKVAVIISGFGQYTTSEREEYKAKCWIKKNREVEFEGEITVPCPTIRNVVSDVKLEEDNWIHAEAGDLIDIILDLQCNVIYYFANGYGYTAKDIEENKVNDYFTVAMPPENGDYDANEINGEIPYISFYLQ